MKGYLLYSDSDQTQLLAMAYNLTQRKQISGNYETGQWFSYDLSEDQKEFFAETERKVKCKFGESNKATPDIKEETKYQEKITAFEVER